MKTKFGTFTVLFSAVIIIVALQFSLRPATAQVTSADIQLVPAQAETPTPTATPDPDYDYGDAPGYGEAKHKIIKDNYLGDANEIDDGFTFENGLTGDVGSNQAVDLQI